MKQHPLCTDTEHGPMSWTSPFPAELKQEWAELQTRRHFLGRGKSAGMGGNGQPAGRSALRGDARAGYGQGPRRTIQAAHFAPKAKRAIYLFMSGGPSQVDLWDYKPNLAALYDKDIPDSVRGGAATDRHDGGQARFPIAPSHWAFKRYGETGTWVSDLLPYTGRMVDDLTIIKSTNTEAINHEPAIMLMNTGNMNAGKPCLGSWLPTDWAA
jgi:hypothetical protein